MILLSRIAISVALFHLWVSFTLYYLQCTLHGTRTITYLFYEHFFWFAFLFHWPVVLILVAERIQWPRNDTSSHKNGTKGTRKKLKTKDWWWRMSTHAMELFWHISQWPLLFIHTHLCVSCRAIRNQWIRNVWQMARGHKMYAENMTSSRRHPTIQSKGAKNASSSQKMTNDNFLSSIYLCAVVHALIVPTQSYVEHNVSFSTLSPARFFYCYFIYLVECCTQTRQQNDKSD